jgi:hypothetical protein
MNYMHNISRSPFVLYKQLDHVPKSKEKVPVQCPKCNAIKMVILASHMQTIRKNNGNYVCHRCSINSEKCSENAKKLWANSELADKVRAHLKSDKMKLILKEKNKRLFADETWKKGWRSNLNREAISKASKSMWQSEEFRKKVLKSFSERCKRQWKDPNYRAKMEAYRKTKEYREKMNELRHSEKFKKRMIEVWSDPDYRMKMNDVRLKNLEKMNKTPSSQQRILYSLLDDLNIKYKAEHRVGFYLVDCFIPKQYNMKCNLIIEVQGDYWHSLPDRINKDKSRATYLRKYFPEYELKYLWEHEFSNKDRILNLLKYWLGITGFENIDFSFKDIIPRLVDVKDAELFISKYHYAGRVGRSGINIGFFLGNVLIGVCIFAYPVRKEVASKQGLDYREVLELSRFAIHPSYQKRNFASFMISRSIRIVRTEKPGVKRLISFSDTTYNHNGTIYKASNWTLDGVVRPDYWYVDQDGYVCHKKTLWNKAKQMSMTELEYCNKYKYKRVFGGEKKRFLYRL